MSSEPQFGQVYVATLYPNWFVMFVSSKQGVTTLRTLALGDAEDKVDMDFYAEVFRWNLNMDSWTLVEVA